MTTFPLKNKVPPHIAALDGYHAAPVVADEPGVLKMDLNECYAPPSPRVLAAVRAAVSERADLNWYPDSTSSALRKAIGGYLNVPAEFVLVANGSNMAMELVARAFLTKDDPVLIVTPAYAVFGVQCRIQQACIDAFQFRSAFTPDFNELIAHSGKHKLIYLANPNNPTGVGYRRVSIKALLEQRPDALVVLDEAYIEYFGESCVELIADHANLVVLRSFSKAFSLAGLRCGYVVAQPAVLDILGRVLAPWAVSALTQIAALAAIEDLDYMRATVAECARARGMMVEALQRLGFVAQNTSTNFILWKVQEPGRVTKALAERKLYVSNKDAVPQMKGYLRVTVGNCKQAERFIEIVRQAQQEGLVKP